MTWVSALSTFFLVLPLLPEHPGWQAEGEGGLIEGMG